jgi:hypothetical protein
MRGESNLMGNSLFDVPEKEKQENPVSDHCYQ